MKFTKYEGNPILTPNPANAWEERCVLNPAVVYDGEKFIMLYRAAGNDKRHQIRLGLAESRDGKHFTRVGNAPVFEGHRDEPDGGCVEDPRLVKMGDLYLLTYAARIRTYTAKNCRSTRGRIRRSATLRRRKTLSITKSSGG